MSSKCRRCAFTLIEVLLVVIIMAVLAATIIPQFTSSTKEAKTSALNFNLQTVRSQLEMYKEQHVGLYPPATDTASFAAQMCSRTNQDTTANASSGLYGPYLGDDLPANPFNDSKTIAIVNGTTAPTAATGSSDGWQYNPATGWFYPNNAEFYQTTGGT
ncbi:MAG: type II secretion system protein [Thermoguttaceae bacterium]|jgi:prepilin-type N-terminal cleavage/methylation domain-containing protein